MRDEGIICLVKSDGWTESGYAVGVSYRGRIYSEDILEEEMRNTPASWWEFSEDVDDIIVSSWRVEFNDELIKYLES